jgi:hypothetical protein
VRFIWLTAIAMLALTASPAQAQDDSYGAISCAFPPGGPVGMSGDGMNGLTFDLEDDDDAWDPLDLTDTDSGTFGLFTDLICVGVDAGGAADVAAGVYGFFAEGDFTSTVCGTGELDGTMTLVGTDNTSMQGTFSAVLAAGAAKLSVAELNGQFGGILNFSPDEISAGGGDGAMHLVPIQSNCVLTGANVWVMSAFALELTFSGS